MAPSTSSYNQHHLTFVFIVCWFLYQTNIIPKIYRTQSIIGIYGICVQKQNKKRKKEDELKLESNESEIVLKTKKKIQQI